MHLKQRSIDVRVFPMRALLLSLKINTYYIFKFNHKRKPLIDSAKDEYRNFNSKSQWHSITKTDNIPLVVITRFVSERKL